MAEYVVIADKDGGLAAELRAPHGELPVYLSPSGDRTNWNESINISASGDTTIHTPATGKRFYVQNLILKNRPACGIQLKSGTTILTGNMSFAANDQLVVSHVGEPPLASKATGDTFIVTTSGDGVTPLVSGWATGYEE